jgi:hypothetical protein
LSLIIPISLGVTLLDYTGVLSLMAGFLNPLFHYLGLSGQCALVFLTSIFLNIYSAIAVISTLPLSMRETTILAAMCLISHNIIVEVMILQKTGSKAWKMVLLRLGSSIIMAIVLNLLLPADQVINKLQSGPMITTPSFTGKMYDWMVMVFWLSLKVAGFVTALMILQKWMEKMGIMVWLSKVLSPLILIMGLPRNSAFLWIVANVLGLGYSAAIMIDYHDQKKISKEENDIVNHHIAVNHSLFEDTLLFMAIGVSAFWITVPRIILAMIIVWLYRLGKLLRFSAVY